MKGRDNSRQEEAMSRLGAMGRGKGAALPGWLADGSRANAHDYQRDMDHALGLIRDAKSRISIYCDD